MWENPQWNRNNFEQKIRSIDEKIDLIVLPEMFTTGFTMNPNEVAETMQGETVMWMQSMAKWNNCAITGSVIIKENEKFYNRMVFVFPNGEMKTYDKRHLFSLAKEEAVFYCWSRKSDCIL